MALQNRLTQTLGIEHPVLLAPMDIVSGGRLAAAVSLTGGLGLTRCGNRKSLSDERLCN
jgi:nitronate monooxygenase